VVIRGDHNVIPPGRRSDSTRPETLGKRPIGKRDIVDISDEAKSHGLARGDRTRSSNLEKLESTALEVRTKIRERIRNGFYSREEVLNHVARKLLELFGI